MRWLVVLGMLAACDRVFGLGDPYEDARSVTGSGDAAIDGGRGSGDGGTLPPLLADFELEANFTDSVSGTSAVCTRANGSFCGFSQGHDGSGASALFDGGTCVIFQLPATPSELSIALWLKPSTTTEETLLARPYSSTGDMSWLLQEGSASIDFQSYSGSLSLDADTTPGISDTGWHFLAVTVAPSGSMFYVDGTSRQSGNGVSIGYSTDVTVYFGCDVTTTALDNFHGQLDNVKIFDGILTPQDVTQLGM